MPVALHHITSVRVARGPIVLYPLELTPGCIVTGQSGDFVIAFDKRTHKKLWKRTGGKLWRRGQLWLRNAYRDTILVNDDDAETTQAWGEDGKIRWQHPGNEQAEDDRIYFNSDGRLKVVDVLTGKTIDEFECPPGPTRFFHDGVLLLSNPDLSTDPIQGVHIARRTAVWSASLKAQIQQTLGDPCPFGLAFLASLPGQVIAKTTAHLVAVSLSDGSLGWHLPISMPESVPLARDGRIYVWAASPHSTTTRVLIDAESDDVQRITLGPDAAENRLMIVDEASGAVLIDRSLASYLPAFHRPQKVYSGVICRNHCVFASNSGLMTAFRLTDGELIWHQEYPANLSSLAFEGNRLYITTTDGDLAIFEARGDQL